MSDRLLRRLFRRPVVLAALIGGCAPSLETGCKSDDDCTPGICSAGTCAPRPDADVTGDASAHDTGSGGRPAVDAGVFDADGAVIVPDADSPVDDAFATGGGFTKPDGRVTGGAGGDDGAVDAGAPPPTDAGGLPPDGTVTVTCDDAGELCDNGQVGVCLTFGVYECQPDGQATCSARRAFGTAEICDGLDNDCDGVVDDAVSIWCFDANPALDGRGACRAGYRLCVGGVVGDECHDQVPPTDEVCNGLDDDCDGVTDEGTDGAACVPDGIDDGAAAAVRDETGICRLGTRACTAGIPGECEGAVLPAALDDCNGLDDDCDGVVDDDCACVAGAPCGEARPAPCRQGVLDCTRDPGDQCVDLVLPQAEICNGTDDDCNGVADDLPAEPCYGGEPGTRGVGVCRAGTQRCDDGEASDCEGEVRPGREICNGLDDDCDGHVDEDFIGLGQPCAVGTGICLVESFARCGADGDSVVCPVSPGPPNAEICNGLDDDCDGNVDEDTDLSCYSGPEPVLGRCRRGISRCVDGRLTACEGEILPANAEICDEDAADENCNGQYNEGCGCQPGVRIPCGEVDEPIGICRPGLSQCTQEGQFGACQGAVNPTVETCNDLDDDCDGDVDEGGLSRECYPGDDPAQVGVGVCRSGTEACEDGEFSDCTGAVTPQPEICNGLDDDCNGSTDDGLPSAPCRTGEFGVCAIGTSMCTAAGTLICQRDTAPSPEACNGRDDNCDNIVDNSPAPTFGPIEIDERVLPGTSASPLTSALAWSAPVRRYAAVSLHEQLNARASVRIRLIEPQGDLLAAVDVTQPVAQNTLRQVRIAALPAVGQLDRVAFIVAWLEGPLAGNVVLHVRSILADGATGRLDVAIPTEVASESWQSFDMVALNGALTIVGTVAGSLVEGSEIRSLQTVRLSFDGAVLWRHTLRHENATRLARDIAVVGAQGANDEYYGVTWTHSDVGIPPPSVAYFTVIRKDVDAGAPAVAAPTRLTGPTANANRAAQAVLARNDGFLTAFLESAGTTNLVIQKFGFDGALQSFQDNSGRQQQFTLAATGERSKSGAVLASMPNADVGVFWRELNNANGQAASLRFRRANTDLGWLTDAGIVVTPIGQAFAGPAVARTGLGVAFHTQEIIIPPVFPPPPVVLRMFDGEVICPAAGNR
jgi:hypothetical protein